MVNLLDSDVSATIGTYSSPTNGTTTTIKKITTTKVKQIIAICFEKRTCRFGVQRGHGHVEHFVALDLDLLHIAVSVAFDSLSFICYYCKSSCIQHREEHNNKQKTKFEYSRLPQKTFSNSDKTTILILNCFFFSNLFAQMFVYSFFFLFFLKDETRKRILNDYFLCEHIYVCISR